MGTTVQKVIKQNMTEKEKKDRKKKADCSHTFKKKDSKQSPSKMKLQLIHLRGNSSLLLTYRCVHTAMHTLTCIKSAII